ncbi:ETEC_3214 domain-containing protein [Moritella dasanensis]|uniref:ETEC_3214 domain-containing protein n=1 Tax=Moritella dasanensis TaxID=428031 RepID=UPI0003192500|nr:ETEC_3214 domain-containing protein [Moritella dasanensis]
MQDETTQDVQRNADEEYDILGMLKQKTPNSLVSIVVLIIGISQFNDAIDMGGKGWDLFMSNFSDNPSNDRLSKVYVRASSEVLDETFGSPVYKKSSEGDTEIKYYKDGKFILSAIISNGTVDAFLVFPQPGFGANTKEHAGGENYLNDNFSDLTTPMNAMSNVARTGNYYLEEAEGGHYEMLYSSIGGHSEYLAPLSNTQLQQLAEFNDVLMMDEDVTESITVLRAHMKPNFYGYSTVDITALEPAILTRLEYELLTK